jgi:hypothetical protein
MSTYFICDGQHYEKNRWCSNGFLSLSPITANFFMEDFEERVLEKPCTSFYVGIAMSMMLLSSGSMELTN